MKRPLPRIAAPLLAISLIFSAGACADLQLRRNLEQCRFALVDVRIVTANLATIKLRLNLSIQNVGDGLAQLDRLSFTLFMQDRRLGEGASQTAVSVPPGETRNVELDFEASTAQLGLEILGLLAAQELNYRVEGVAFVDTSLGTFPYPFTIEQTLRR